MAVYVMAITAPFFPFGAGNSIQTTGTDMTFLLDGNIVGSFLQKTVSGCCAEYQYNVPVYVNESLLNTQHTLTVETGVRGNKVITLLDQIIYTSVTTFIDNVKSLIFAKDGRRGTTIR